MLDIGFLTKDKTVIMIAHKLNTVKEANKIIVFDNGKISQMGNHEELINQEGIYKRFIEERTSAQSWKI